MDWAKILTGQLEFYWEVHLRPRLDGLTDEEYLWEPAPGCWSLREDADGNFKPETAWPEPSPAPLTTIAWRMAHIGIGCFIIRTSAFFGDGSVPDDADMFDQRRVPASWPHTAAEAVTLLERSYQEWFGAISRLDDEAMSKPLGPKGGPYAADSMAALVVHLNREVMHHGGEIGLMRDFYRTTVSAR